MKFFKKYIKVILAVVLLLLLVIGSSVFFVTCSKNADTDSKKGKENKYSAENTQSPEKIKYPWKEGGKKPSEYTWEEFEALSGPQQMEFQKSFDSTEKFDEWMIKAKGEDKVETNPWEEDGAKKPSDYTWKEFDNLTGAQQIEFQRSFDSADGFDKWLKENQPD